MKKLIPIFAFFAFLSVNAQFNQETPWMQSLDLENRSTPITFQEIVDAGNTYWESHDKDARGSGYKPFKRWEAYWQNYVGEDGLLPTSAQLWNGWLEKKAQSANRDALADNSNWISLGPTDFTNRPVSTANIGRVNAITVDPNNPNTYYAGAPAGGIWKSTDAGLNWTPLSDELPQIGVSGIAVDHSNSDIIYIATGDDDASDTSSAGVWKSIDGGSSWQQTGLNPTNTPNLMNDIYMHPSNSNILWVATTSGVYKTTNGGTNWTNTQGGNVRDIKIKPGDPSVVYAVTSGTFYVSTDGGDSFSPSMTGLPGTSTRLVIDVTPANPNLVYVVSAGGGSAFQGVFKSTNSGGSFAITAQGTTDIFQSTQAWYDLALAVSDIDENEVYVGVLNIWKSSDGGDSFAGLNNWASHNATFTHADIHLLRFYNGELYAGTDGGFYKSANQGSTFEDLTKGMEISQFYRIDVSPNTSGKIIGGLQDNGGYGFANNRWRQYHGGDGMEGVIDPNNDNIYYGFLQFGGTLFRSTTSGQGNTGGFAGPEQGNWITPLVVNSNSEVYGGYNSLYQFISNSWTQISPSFGTPIDRLEIDDLNTDNVYVAINNTIRKSVDKGVSFSNVESFPSFVSSIEVNTTNSNIVYVTTSGINGRVYRSTNAGVDYTDITGSLPSISKLVIKHQSNSANNTLYLGTSIGVYRYDDVLGDWEVFENNLPNVPVTDLAINVLDNNITASTYGRGVWRSNLADGQLPSNDISLLSIDAPNTFLVHCGDVTPQVSVKNNGQNTITSVSVDFNIDGGSNTNFTWNGSLASLGETTIDLPTMTLARGLHILNVTTTITNDTNASNNTSEAIIYANDSGVSQLINTFESASDALLTYNEDATISQWERGVPAGTLLNSTASGSNAYGTNLDGNYIGNRKANLYSQCYDLSNITNPVLKFDMAFDLEQDWDLVYMEYTLDNGSHWNILGSASDPNWYNSSRIANDGLGNDCFNCVGAQWTGTDATMQEYSYDLAALNSETNIIFRFVFRSDQSVNQEGVVVDDFYVDGTLSTESFTLGDVRVYPNPSDNIFNIKLNNISDFNYTVTDITGKIVIEQRDITQSNYALNMTDFASGLYFLNIEADGSTLTKKLILK